MSIGKKIFELRTAKNLSQGDLAEILDVSRQSVSKWETDSAVPDLDKLMKLCDVFQVTLDELTGRVEKVPEPIVDLNVSCNNETDTIKDKHNVKHSVGIVLLTIGLVSIVLGILLSPILVIAGVFLVVCSGLCLSVKRWFWAAVAVFALAYFLGIVILFLNYTMFPSGNEDVTEVEEAVIEVSAEY